MALSATSSMEILNQIPIRIKYTDRWNPALVQTFLTPGLSQQIFGGKDRRHLVFITRVAAAKPVGRPGLTTLA